ncbi:DUF4232 domain-containing protein [Streptomyces daliensis]|uniref:DUF4232 domain-containing protein n=1 Tax=Streptomyces daliensis TaxID=299421 RepID=A0A8T4IM58_9ACTN|nr:DUF4232 domain-containing protein [Streptomyces daliensis]
MRAQKITIAALALAAGLSLTACQGNDTSAAGSKDSGSSSSSSSTGTSGGSGDSDSGSTGGSSGSGSAGGSGENATNTGDDSDSTQTEAQGGEGSGNGQITTGTCKTSNLALSAAHGMGEGDVVVTFKNTGEACSLKGFPGVDLKADGGPGGISANRSDLDAPAVALQNGDETRFTLHTPRNDTGGSGVDIDRLVVTPPNGTHSKTVKIGLNIPVTDHSTSDVTVDPVGTGKQ